ncbi:MAG TPA: Hsp20/alpha crystallin family protein [Chloroflexota bacterium]|nr:Hsp20/alpha crystallin family protein [Chloroflexota bacterium]
MTVRYRYVSYGVGPSILEQMQQVHQLMHQMMMRAAPASGGAWQPPTDVVQTDDAMVVQVELAGVKEEDIDITLFADHLAISGVRHNRIPPGTAAYQLAGILYGEFRVEIPVTRAVERERVDAAYEDGLLTVVLPMVRRQIEPTSVRIGQGSHIVAGEATPQGDSHGH